MFIDDSKSQRVLEHISRSRLCESLITQKLLSNPFLFLILDDSDEFYVTYLGHICHTGSEKKKKRKKNLCQKCLEGYELRP